MTITCLTLGWAVSYRGQKNLEKLNLLPKNFTSTVSLVRELDFSDKLKLKQQFDIFCW